MLGLGLFGGLLERLVPERRSLGSCTFWPFFWPETQVGHLGRHVSFLFHPTCRFYEWPACVQYTCVTVVSKFCPASLAAPVAPTARQTMLGPRCVRRTRLFFIQEKRPDIPPYIMLDSITDTFSCISPVPVLHLNDPPMQNKVWRGPHGGLSVS
jgi:hypothetical protein